MNKLLTALFASVCWAPFAAAAEPPLILQSPSLSADHIAFRYADDIWTTGRSGGDAERLTSIGSVVAGPFYSPDGKQIAYSARTHSGVNVYVLPAEGGVPRRITWHPSASQVVGWSPDGKSVLINSGLASVRGYTRLFRVAIEGSGTPEPLPLPSGFEGAYSPDGASLAYEPLTPWQSTSWKRYHGGQTTPIWLVNLKTLDLVKVPRDNSNDSQPVWVGDSVFFLSDRAGPVSLFKYDVKAKTVAPVVPNTGLDLKSLQAGPGGLVYEQFGALHLYDLAAGKDQVIHVRIHGDLPSVAPTLTTAKASEINNAAVSPSGARVAFEAHGEIFTVPAEKGDTRNLTQTPGAAERDPAWSPDGKSLAYFGDASGEYRLYIQDPSGLKPATVIDLAEAPSFFYTPLWSPDSKKIVFYDKHLRLWIIDAAGGEPVLVDTGVNSGFSHPFSASWSADSQWLAYCRDLDNGLNGIFLYSLAEKTHTQVTDGMSDASNPTFDAGGKLLYFTASTDDGPSQAGIDLSSLDRAQTSSVYAVVLKKSEPSPLKPESDDEKAKGSGDDDAKTGDADGAKKAEPKKAKKDKAPKREDPSIDLDGIGDRIIALPIPARNYVQISAGKTGVLYLGEGAPVGRSSEDGPPIRTLWKFVLDKRQTDPVLWGLDAFAVSADGGKLLYGQNRGWSLIGADELKPGGSGRSLNLSKMQMRVDPRAEWRQMFEETWRIQRDFFYDPKLHGLDLDKVKARYRPYLDGLASRSEFTALSEEMLGEITVGHMFVGGPHPDENGPHTGLLGADYTVDQGRYRFAKIFGGQSWTPGLASPLTQPGVSVRTGEYLIAVNGKPLHASDNLYAAFDGLAGRQTTLTVADKPDGEGGREVLVVPVGSERGLRQLDWIEGNRKKVDALSGGKVAYVYMPNTGGAGYTNFNRYFYAQLNRDGLILDDRYNQGGFIADYVVDVLSRKPLSGAVERDGRPQHDPIGAIFGPKVMLINENAGSGGDAMPWYFKKAGLGTLIGKRTWGGLVGIGGYPTLMDGGSVTAPRYAIYGLDGEWEVENHGVAPDIEVEQLPKDVAAGHDKQLETAVAEVMAQLKAHPVPKPVIPPYPNYHQKDGLGGN